MDSARIDQENRFHLEQQRQFRRAADVLADAWAAFSEVAAVALIGSVARPLCKEVPRFGELRKRRIEVWHECKDLDVALWLDTQHRLGELRRAAAIALRKARESDDSFRVSDFQVDTFLIDPGTGRYLGRLCRFSTCPKGKEDCFVPGCGDIPFNRRFPAFEQRAELLAPAAFATLYRRGSGRLRSALDLPATTECEFA